MFPRGDLRNRSHGARSSSVEVVLMKFALHSPFSFPFSVHRRQTAVCALRLFSFLFSTKTISIRQRRFSFYRFPFPPGSALRMSSPASSSSFSFLFLISEDGLLKAEDDRRSVRVGRALLRCRPYKTRRFGGSDSQTDTPDTCIRCRVVRGWRCAYPGYSLSRLQREHARYRRKGRQRAWQKRLS